MLGQAWRSGHESMILQEIVDNKRREVEERTAAIPAAEVQLRAVQAPSPRQLALGQRTAVIAEVKRRSPSKGQFVVQLDPVAQARAYEQGGASAISVLTDQTFFGGNFDDLEAVREAVDVPVLCKDFILSSYQVYEARSHGADLLLLIVAAVDDEQLHALQALSLELGMTPLVEVHDQHDLARAIAADARLIGINNRDLRDFSVNLLTTEYLAPLVPDEAVIVSESGIETREDVQRAARAGARAVLVGEALMTSSDPAATIAELLA
jgi:indole-3-glycerol phosphate synthase